MEDRGAATPARPSAPMPRAPTDRYWGGMTVHERTILQLSDVLALRLTCARCQSTATIPLEKFQQVPASCPGCREEWFSRRPTDHERIQDARIRELGKLLQELPQIKDPFELTLELVPGTSAPAAAMAVTTVTKTRATESPR